MTHGYLCNTPGCGVFSARMYGVAEYTITLVDDDGKDRTEKITAHFCSDCAINECKRLELLNVAEAGTE